MNDPIAYHVIFSTYGFWPPNDPRGSGSTEVRAPNLRPFGPATPSPSRESVAAVPHDHTLRRMAKQSLKYPEVIFDGYQALSVAKGFATLTARSGYQIHACSILPSHVHMVIAGHHYGIDQVGRLLRQAATKQLLADGRHPFADLRSPTGRLPSVWAQDFWKVFLYTEADVLSAITYVEANPGKECKRPQKWSFVIPLVFAAAGPVPTL
jgi:REP element-mobilizing transposase RayT